jgi:hypothetical protein
LKYGIILKALFIFLLFALSLEGVPCGNLLDDLLIVESINQEMNDRFPVTYNHLFYGGYFNMPSARMSKEGILGAGFSYVPPYHNYNLYCQLTSFLEISGNYRVFRGVDDPILTPLGFGDMSDKGANVKFALFHPEDSHYKLPGLAVGFEDIMGTRNFKSKYIVLTQVFLKENFEISVGIGANRIRRWFGGISWMPFRKSQYRFLSPISLVAEYDATPYKSEKIEKHPKGRSQKCKINGGVKYRLFDAFDFSLSYVRGEKFAGSIATYYDFGSTKGFIPKIDDALVYKAPIVREALGETRSESMLVHDLAFALNEQGIELLKIELGYDECRQKTLRLRIYNDTYRLESKLREHLNCLLAGLIPEDIEKVIVVIDAEGFPIQEYHFPMALVRAYGDKEMGGSELALMAPLKEVDYSDPFCYTTLFEKNREAANWLILPKTHTFFGSSKGKFKYSLGVNVGVDGFFASDIYYSVLFGYNAISNLYDLSDTDRLNPSQIINVRTDIVRYYQQKAITLDEAYLQKCWNMGKGYYSKVAFGYFEEEYAGLATQFLYYPLHCPVAIGVEGAIFKKRSYKGYGFTSKVRKLHGFIPKWKNFPFGSQYFLDFYYDWKAARLEFKVQMGKFLANDYGVRTEVSRYFDSGLRVTFWYTHTNAHDHINGSTYYDKGVELSLPLDLFYTESSRKRWAYGMSAWLRDVGVTASTGQDLYELISDQRQ